MIVHATYYFFVVQNYVKFLSMMWDTHPTSDDGLRRCSRRIGKYLTISSQIFVLQILAGVLVATIVSGTKTPPSNTPSEKNKKQVRNHSSISREKQQLDYHRSELSKKSPIRFANQITTVSKLQKIEYCMFGQPRRILYPAHSVSRAGDGDVVTVVEIQDE